MLHYTNTVSVVEIFCKPVGFTTAGSMLEVTLCYDSSASRSEKHVLFSMELKLLSGSMIAKGELVQFEGVAIKPSWIMNSTV